MLNNQPIEKRVHKADRLDVHSIFYTIQGEGPFSGYPAVFVRLAGCNLQCPLCDTEYTEGRKAMTNGEILNDLRRLLAEAEVPSGQSRLVVISGGEPFRQPIGPLIADILHAGYAVQIETNGTLPPPKGYDWTFRPAAEYEDARGTAFIVCSPKSGKLNPKIVELACCFKYVLSADSQHHEDGLPLTALGHSAHPMLARPPMGWRRPIYLQPADHQDPEINNANEAAVVKACLKHGYTLQLQTHKYLGLE